jgi:hypothetical protein
MEYVQKFFNRKFRLMKNSAEVQNVCSRNFRLRVHLKQRNCGGNSV